MKPFVSLRPLLALVAVVVASLSASGALGGEPASLRITQALAQGTEVTAYVALRDEADAPATAESMARAHATLGTQVAEVVSAKPFADTSEGVLYVFLVDISRSLDTAQFDRLRQAMRDWVTALGTQDRAAIVSFGTQVHTLVAPTTDRAALTTAIDGLRATDNRTALHQALAHGLTLGQQRGTDLPSRRALVILSDGQDDAPGGMTAAEVDHQLADGAVPIYAIGFSRAQERAPREAGLAALGRFARLSGGVFVDASTGDPSAAYAGMRERIRAVQRLQLRCATCTADGNRYRLQIALPVGSRTLSDGVDVRLYPVATPPQPEAAPPVTPAPAAPPPPATPTPPVAAPPPPAPAPTVITQAPTDVVQQPKAWWPWLLGAGLLVLVLLIVLASRRRTPPTPTPLLAVPPNAPPAPDLAPTRATVQRVPATPRGPALTLAFMDGPRRGQVARLLLAPDGLIGRTNACALALTGDDEVSARHARCFIQDRRLLVEDLDSTNGTWLNGVRVTALTPVREGDVLRCGQTELRLGGVENAAGESR
jgi:Mg-chelatase subunit ChlD